MPTLLRQQTVGRLVHNLQPNRNKFVLINDAIGANTNYLNRKEMIEFSELRKLRDALRARGNMRIVNEKVRAGPREREKGVFYFGMGKKGER